MPNQLLSTLFLSACLLIPSIQAADYTVDHRGAHASINFKIKHLGYSWLKGRFNRFSGEFSYDPKQVEQSKINLIIDVNSIDSNHAARDKHLRSADYLNIKQHPQARFTSTTFKDLGQGKATLAGQLTLNGVTKPIIIAVEKIGEGKDPWGGYRAGFSGTTQLKLVDFGYTFNLGPASQHVELELHVEGIRN